MGKYSKKRIPKGFRYLFSIKEVKEIEEISNLNFYRVSNGNLNKLKNKFQILSIHSKIDDEKWTFHLYQNGFGIDVLSSLSEKEAKLIIREKTISFIQKIYNSIETDLYKNPQLWCEIILIENDFKIEWTEFK